MISHNKKKQWYAGFQFNTIGGYIKDKKEGIKFSISNYSDVLLNDKIHSTYQQSEPYRAYYFISSIFIITNVL